jgi:putative transposase
MQPDLASHSDYRFPAEIISHAVWLYHVFSFSLRDVEPSSAERGITVTHESIRQWGLRFGADFAQKLRRHRPKPGDTRHLDEIFLRINGVLHCLWRAVDQHEVVLEVLFRGCGASSSRYKPRHGETAASHLGEAGSVLQRAVV